MAQLIELQAACSHTAQLFLKRLIPGAAEETSHLFISLKNHRQLHYETQSLLPIETRIPYGMHHILKYIRRHTVRDDAVALHVVEHDMLLHVRAPAQNIYVWCLSFAPNVRRHKQATKRPMTVAENDMLITKILAAQLTFNELETIAAIDTNALFTEISKGKFDIFALKSLVSKNLTRFKRTFKDDRRIQLFRVNHEIRMRGKQPAPEASKKRKFFEKAPAKAAKPRSHGNPAFLAKTDLKPHQYCTFPKCKTDGKDHTHTPDTCGFIRRESSQRAETPAKYNRDRPDASRRPPSSTSKTIKCFFCGGDHMKRDCAKFMKLQKSSTFMAMIEEYEPEEIEYLDLLICTTNRKVCKWCLDKSCNGACPEVSPSMTSAKCKC